LTFSRRSAACATDISRMADRLVTRRARSASRSCLGYGYGLGYGLG
jgi:hypothetical protein